MAEIDPADLRAFATQMRQMADDLKNEREIRAKEAKEGISILRLHIPLAVVLVMVGVLASAGIAGGMFMRATDAHVANPYVHADETKAVTRGGIAYAADVKEALGSAVSDLEAGQRRIGRAVRAARCAADRKGVVVCQVPDPETLPLRP